MSLFFFNMVNIDVMVPKSEENDRSVFQAWSQCYAKIV